MRAVLRKEDLESVVSKAARCSDERSPIFLLRNLLLRVGEGRLSVFGCDLYSSYESSAEAAIDSPGAVTAPAKDLLDRVKAMPDGPVAIELDGERLILKGKSRKHILPTLPANDYPPFPVDKWDPMTFRIGAKLLRGAFDATRKVIDEKKIAHLSATHFWAVGGTMTVCVLTDHRCHKLNLATECPDITGSVMLPPKAAEDLRSQLTGDGTVEVAIGQTWASFALGGGVYKTKLVHWEQPSPFYRTIEQVTPTQRHPVKVPRALALEALEAAKGFEHVRLTFKPGKIAVDASDSEGKSSSDEIPIEYSGPERMMALKTSYALDLFMSAPTDGFVDVEPQFATKLKRDEEDSSQPSIQGDGGPVFFTLRAGDYTAFAMPVGIK